MKSITILAAAVLGSTCHAQYEKFPDVPENHWVFQALLHIKMRGLLTDLPDGFFRRPPSRREFAPVITRATDDLEREIASLEKELNCLDSDLCELYVESVGYSVNYPEILALLKISEEFAPELAKLKVDVPKLKQRLAHHVSRNDQLQRNLASADSLLERAGNATRNELAMAIAIKFCSEVTGELPKPSVSELKGFMQSDRGQLRRGAVVLLTRLVLADPMPHFGTPLNSASAIALMGMRETELSVLFNTCGESWGLAGSPGATASKYEQLHRMVRVLEKVEGIDRFWSGHFLEPNNNTLAQLAIYGMAMDDSYTERLYGLAVTRSTLATTAWQALSRYRRVLPACRLGCDG